jgi:hypothetical protein
MDVERGATAPLVSKAAASRRPIMILALGLAVSALAGFAVGTKTMRPASAMVAAGKHHKGSDAYIVADCTGADNTGSSPNQDKHIKYFKGRTAKPPQTAHDTKQQYLGAGWYCAYDDGTMVWDIKHVHGGTMDRVTEFDDTMYTVRGPSADYVVFYDTADIHKDCDRAAFDQDHDAWRCLDESDFHSKGLSPHDFVDQVNTAAIATFASYPGGVDLYAKGGNFANMGEPSFYLDYGDGKGYVIYHADKREDIQGDDYKIWRDKKHGTDGYYLIKKECDGAGSCWMNFVCTKYNTDDVLANNC